MCNKRFGETWKKPYGRFMRFMSSTKEGFLKPSNKESIFIIFTVAQMKRAIKKDFWAIIINAIRLR